MFYSAMDREVTLEMRQKYELEKQQDLGQQPAEASAADEGWEPEEGDSGAAAWIAEEPDMWKERDLFRNDPAIHIGRSAGTITIHNSDMVMLDSTYRISGLDQAAGGLDRGQALKELWVGPVKLEIGSWFLCRPDEVTTTAAGHPVPQQMWFGKVMQIIRHRGGDGRVREVLKAEWYRATPQPDPLLRCPIMRDRPVHYPGGPWYLPLAVVPWFCFALPHPSKNGHLVVLARHWHIMRNYPEFQWCKG